MTKTFAALGVLLAMLGLLQAQEKAETQAQRGARMGWWHEAKFGLFIHWGVYAVPAGYYKGKAYASAGEWIMRRAKIPMSEYQAFAKEFNPVKYDADAWVLLAKEAGMKYIVITSKHHDGFTLYGSKASAWNVCDATPYGKDLLQALADACRKHGIKLGFYYSQAQDWNNGGAAGAKWDPAQERSMDEYIDLVAVPQVREILTRYGKDVPAVLWWDTPQNMNQERAAKLYRAAHELRPDLIQNNRLGGDFKGDTETPEQRIPPQGYPGRDWETCMTMNRTWGFKRDDQDWKSTETLIRNLVDIVSKGGNYLLNVGPTAEGEIPQPSVQRLKEIGAWMKVNGEAIYGAGSTPFGAEVGQPSDTEKDKSGKPKFVTAWEWRSTTRPGKIYLHIFKWPTGAFQLPPIKSKVEKAYLLADRSAKLGLKQTASGVSISLPDRAPDPIASVICLETH